MPAYRWDVAQQAYIDLQTGEHWSPNLPYEYTEANPPWAYTNTAEFRQGWPSGVNVVPIQTGSADFWTNVNNTVAAAGGRCVIELGEGVYHLKSFRKAGSGPLETYAFGLFFSNLQGFVGQGPDKTFIQMDANSVSQAQLDEMATMDPQSFAPLQMAVARFDGTAASPVLLGGLTFRSADQQNLTSKHANLNIVVPQPAPHNGVILYQNSHSIINNVRFQAAGRAASSAPPFECGSLGSQYGTHTWRRIEIDGRRSPDIDSARPRRCGILLGNNESVLTIEDFWFHHSNVSRYAVNDENRDTQGVYTARRGKIEQITNTKNTDPALNGGASLGGWTNATPFGWESCNGTILVENVIISQDNNDTSVQWPAHLQLTSVGSRNPQGGRLTARNNVYRNTGWPYLDGFLTMRIANNTYWWTDGFATTLTVEQDGNDLTAYTVTGSWPPSQSELTAAGVTPATHYLVRRA